jgi:YidC/Oxa1 family membrane protein insertase
MNPFAALQHVLGALLSLFYSMVPNYGVAIILLTLAVTLVLSPLTIKQTRSMRAMQAIQPEVKAIQKALKGDREELSKRLTELYKERGVSPTAGCLPSLIQLPIWLALYRVLRVGVDAAGTGLTSTVIPDGRLARALIHGGTNFLTMDLLRSPAEALARGSWDATPYLLLVLLVVGGGYYQMIQSGRRRSVAGERKQRGTGTVSKIMPVFFGLISWSLPTGLVVYFAASSLFRIGLQSAIVHIDEPDTEPARGASGPHDQTDDSEVDEE